MAIAPNFDKCVEAIADTIVGRETSAMELQTVTSFLRATHAKMPDYLRFGFHVLVLAFDLWSYPTSGKPFHALAFEGRNGQLRRWEQSRLKVKRSFVLFYRTLATFGLHSDRSREESRLGVLGENG